MLLCSFASVRARCLLLERLDSASRGANIFGMMRSQFVANLSAGKQNGAVSGSRMVVSFNVTGSSKTGRWMRGDMPAKSNPGIEM